MNFDDELEEKTFETTDGDVYWAESGANYIGSAGKVVLSCRDTDGQETSDTFMPSEALGLAIELARAAGVHESYLLGMERRLKWTQTEELTKEIWRNMGELDAVSRQMFNVDLFDRSMTLAEVRAVVERFL